MLKKIREYKVPINRMTECDGQTIYMCNQKKWKGKSFFEVLFKDSNLGEIIERQFEIFDGKTPEAIIKSIIPLKRFQNIEKVSQELNIELEIDKKERVNKIEKEIILTWPSDEEAKYLRLVNDSQVVVEKLFFLNDLGEIVRYEEEVSRAEYYIFKE